MAGRWIGRGGPITWAPRSSDLTPFDFFLWGYVKNIVYQVRINDLQHLKACIRDTMATVTPNMLQATRGMRLNVVSIFVMPPRKPTLKFIEKVIDSEKRLIVSLCNGVTHKCV
jgi:hypothetical protein